MRSKSCYTVLFIVLFLSCHPHGTATGEGPGIPDSLAVRIRGTYNGHFKEGLMTLVINYISDSIVSGYDLHKGRRRNVNGSVLQKGDRLEFLLKEPGNNALDGTFYLSMDTTSRNIAGKWIPAGDSTKVHTGALDLRRWDKDTSANQPSGTWYGDMGSISFNTEMGTCELGYSPDNIPSAKTTTILGNYWQKKDTFYIEWEPNKLLPAR